MFLNLPMTYSPESKGHVVSLPDGTAYTVKGPAMFAELFTFLFFQPNSAYACLTDGDIAITNTCDERAALRLSIKQARRMADAARVQKPAPSSRDMAAELATELSGKPF
jgi:hypothetical protein